MTEPLAGPCQASPRHSRHQAQMRTFASECVTPIGSVPIFEACSSLRQSSLDSARPAAPFYEILSEPKQRVRESPIESIFQPADAD
ncbi:hypothetical protein ACVWZZ_003589 [Bradyrhizobium sp. LM6.10]